MDQKLRHYADMLFERALFESARTLQVDRRKYQQERAARSASIALPISGTEVQGFERLFVQHIDRCMEARLESFRKALQEAGQHPTEDDLQSILTAVRETQVIQIGHATQAIQQLIKTRGGVLADFDPKIALVALSARAHDRILGDWKVWRAQVQLSAERSTAPGDWHFANMALEEARKSVAEDDRVHPMVGAVVVKDGKVISQAHRGETPASHAEFIALEKKHPDSELAGSTVYTTLEPCTTRNHPKIPCVERLIERKVSRVVIGMLDPDPRITGRGQRRLRQANITTDLFPSDLMSKVEELNRKFTREHESGKQSPKSATPEAIRPADNSSAANQVQDKWVNLGFEHKSGMAEALTKEEYDFAWISADKEAEKIELEGWQYALHDSNGVKSRLKIRDHPAIGGYLFFAKKPRSKK